MGADTRFDDSILPQVVQAIEHKGGLLLVFSHKSATSQIQHLQNSAHIEIAIGSASRISSSFGIGLCPGPDSKSHFKRPSRTWRKEAKQFE